MDEDQSQPGNESNDVDQELVGPGAAAAREAEAARQAQSQEASADKTEKDAPAEEAKPEGEGISHEQYEPTGEPGLDIALDYIGSLGFAHTHPAIQAATQGDFGPIEAALKAKGETGYDKYIALAKDAYGRVVAKESAEKQVVANAVFATVGGEDVWGEIVSFAKENVSPEEKVVFDRLLGGNALEARLAAAFLADCYRKAQGEQYQKPAKVTKSVPDGVDTPLSPGEAVLASRKLAERVGKNNIDNHPEYKAIWARVRD